MSNRKALTSMTLALATTWALAYGLDYVGVPHVYKLAAVISWTIAGCMVGALLFFIAKKLYPEKDAEPPP